MNWYLQSGKDSDVVISSRIKFSRNLKDFKFNLKDRNSIEQLENKIKDNLYLIGYDLKFIKLKDLDDITKQSLVEKNLITQDFAFNKSDVGSILINDEENICIMINEEDHLKIQVFSSGLDLENTLNLAIEIDKKIGNILGYATSKKYGYLTSNPNNCGTGLRASVLVHLPALLETGNINQIFDIVSRFEVNIKRMNNKIRADENDMFLITNKKTLGLTENEISESIKIIAQKITEQERRIRKLLAKNSIELEDRIYRSYGILTNCRKISLEEANKLLSYVKLGTDLGILKELDDLRVQKLYLYIKPANMQKYLGKVLNSEDKDIERASIIKQIIDS